MKLNKKIFGHIVEIFFRLQFYQMDEDLKFYWKNVLNSFNRTISNDIFEKKLQNYNYINFL